jgi:AMMECR1 domain-containing protein
MKTVPLRDAIRALRTEIVEAAKDAATENVRFELGPIDLEFQVVAKTEIGSDAKIGAKVGFHIFTAEAALGGSGKGADEATQKVKVVLNPVLVGAEGPTKVEVGRHATSADGQQSKSTLERP